MTDLTMPDMTMPDMTMPDMTMPDYTPPPMEPMQRRPMPLPYLQPTAAELLALLGSHIQALAKVRRESGLSGMEPDYYVFAPWDVHQAAALGTTAIVDESGRIVVRFES